MIKDKMRQKILKLLYAHTRFFFLNLYARLTVDVTNQVSTLDFVSQLDFFGVIIDFNCACKQPKMNCKL